MSTGPSAAAPHFPYAHRTLAEAPRPAETQRPTKRIIGFISIADEFAQVEELRVIADRLVRESMTSPDPHQRRDASEKATATSLAWWEARVCLLERVAQNAGLTVDQLKRICA